MADLYQILGVNRSASAAELKSAYHKLAKKLHPDVNPGRKDIEQKFKEVTAAYDLLSDPDKRARYDRGEIDGQGQERGFSGGFRGTRTRPGAGGYSGGGAGYGNFGQGGGDPFSAFGMDDIFAEFMGGSKAKRGFGGGSFGNERPQTHNIRGNDITYSITIPFTEACLGGKQRVNLTNDKTVDITIPAGVESGHKLRLKGQGSPGIGGGAGDAIIEITVTPHASFTRKGNDIHQDIAISLPEAILGGSVTVPTLDGHVALKIPKGANTGTQMRLKGKGAAGGDMFVRLMVSLPNPVPQDLAAFIEKWAKKNSYDPRK